MSESICFLIFSGSHAGFSFEECAEGRLAWEVQPVGNFAHKHILAFQQDLSLDECRAVHFRA